MDWDNLPTLDDLMEQGLLTEQQSIELEIWFRASCRAQMPLDLPTGLRQALDEAMLLSTLDQQATRH